MTKDTTKTSVVAADILLFDDGWRSLTDKPFDPTIDLAS